MKSNMKRQVNHPNAYLMFSESQGKESVSSASHASEMKINMPNVDSLSAEKEKNEKIRKSMNKGDFSPFTFRVQTELNDD